MKQCLICYKEIEDDVLCQSCKTWIYSRYDDAKYIEYLLIEYEKSNNYISRVSKVSKNLTNYENLRGDDK